MNFAEFQVLRDRLLAERTGLIDCAATNLYAALARRIPPGLPTPDHPVHRCHLAAEWVESFGFAPETSRRALISCGVRDSLAQLFGFYATVGARVWLPADNYPVYAALAGAAGLSPREFVTLPAPVWPNEPPLGTSEILLVTNPLKPLGRWLTDGDVAALTRWLEAQPSRRLFLDAVYTFEARFHPTTHALLATGQTVLLHSLTKGWLHPRLFGVSFVPEADFAALSPVFRLRPPPQANLARARQLMQEHAGLPAVIARDLAAARGRLRDAVPEAIALDASTEDAPGYFAPIEGAWQSIFERTNVLGLPASVFGSARPDLTILSSLSFVA